MSAYHFGYINLSRIFTEIAVREFDVKALSSAPPLTQLNREANCLASAGTGEGVLPLR